MTFHGRQSSANPVLPTDLLEVAVNTRGRVGRVLLLSLVLLMTARTFQYFPGMSIPQELAFLLAPLGLMVVAARSRRAVGRTWAFETYIVLLMIAMPVWSGIAAQQAHGQPMLYGILSWRGYALMSVPLTLLYAMRSGWILTQDIGRAFMACAWFTLVLFASMTLLLDPADYLSYGIGFIEDRFVEGYRFKFSPVFATYAMFNYGVRAFREHRPEFYLLALLFFFFLFGSAGGRIFTVSVLATTLLLMYRWGGMARFFQGGSALAVIALAMVGFGALIAPESTAERLNKFSQAFSVFATDADDIDDASAASRVLQTLVALPLIEERPLAGGGRVSAQWVEKSFAGLLGVYFYPDDIGLIGMVYQFGFVGTGLFALQLLFAWSYSQRLIRSRANTVSDTCIAYLLYLLVSSVATGAFVMFPEFSLLLIAVVAQQGLVDA